MSFFLLGLIIGSLATAYIFYRFYHLTIVTDLKRIIEELQAKQ